VGVKWKGRPAVTTFDDLIKKADQEKTSGGWGYLIVPVVLFSAFMLYPAIRLIVLSFQEGNIVAGTAGFVGLRNYRTAFQLNGVGMVILRSFGKALAPDKLAALVFIPLGIAALLRKTEPASRNLLRTLFFMCLLGGSVWISVMSMYDRMMHILQFGKNPLLFQLLFHLVDAAKTLSIGIPFGIAVYLALTPADTGPDGPLPADRLTSGLFGPGALVLLLTSFAFALQSFTSEVLVSLSISSNLIELSYIRSFLHARFGVGAVYTLIPLFFTSAAGIFMYYLTKRRRIIIWLGDPMENAGGTGKGNSSAAAPVVGWVICILIILGSVTLIFLALRNAAAPLLHGQPQRFPLQGHGRSMARTAAFLLGVIVVDIIFGWMGGYALGTRKFIGKRIVLFLFYVFIFSTPVLITPPLYIMSVRMGLIDTLIPVFFAYSGMPLAVLLFKTYYEGRSLRMVYASLHQVKDHGRPEEAVATGTTRQSMKDASQFALFTTGVLLLLHLNSLMLPLLFNVSARSRLLPAFLFRLFFSMQGKTSGDINAYVLISFLPILIIISALFIYCSIKMLPRLRIVVSKKDM
jgi:ABC-type glycerol-3-phosphate transport system permease component